MLVRVSNLEAFRQWREAEDQGIEDLIARLHMEPTPAMLAGTAFHRALELATYGDHDALYANGYAFQLPEGEFPLPTIREVRASKQYGPLTVTGCVDALSALRIGDHKTTSRMDAERYMAGYQWRFYLDIFDAEIFEWNVFELAEIKPYVYQVADPQILRQYRYPAMHADCARLAADFYSIAREFLPEFAPMRDAA